MVCKKSLYCWKNGPCASDQTRKQIWEDNIRIRESLRNINLSDHYWSFQISKNLCVCLEDENFFGKPLGKSHHTRSLQKLNEVSCTSITHNCNGLKFRNCFVHCPEHNSDKEKEINDTSTSYSASLKNKDCIINRVSVESAAPLTLKEKEKCDHSPKHRKTFSNSSLKPTEKRKSSSHPNLLHSSHKLHKKVEHTSSQDVMETSQDSITSNYNSIAHRQSPQPKINEQNLKVANPYPKNISSKLNPLIKFPKLKNQHVPSPVSRTTRKMLCENKKHPFITFGCNDSNHDIGQKKTHNVFASEMGVYPNALLAKQKKKDLLLKSIQSEKEFQKKCLLGDTKKESINHSSLWSIESERQEKKLLPQENNFVHLNINKLPKKPSTALKTINTPAVKMNQKPQIKFY